METKNNYDYRKLLIMGIGILMSIFHIMVLGFKPMETWAYRTYHVLFAVILILLTKPIKFKNKKWGLIFNFILIASALASFGYIAMNSEELVLYMQYKPKTFEIVLCTIGVTLVLETTRRCNGNAMPLLAIFFLVYSYFGKYLPGAIGHKGYSISRVMTYSFSLEGVFGTSIGVSATYMILFVIFGAILQGTGGSTLIIDLSTAGFGRYRGGPGKVALFASAGMGMMSGSSAGNVVTTGAFTIPLMKKTGYKSDFAAAVEAVASTGGQIMPPVMGAGAFIMAETLGIQYLSIAAAAIIPAILYFTSAYFMIDAEAMRLNLYGLPKDKLPNAKRVLREYGHLMIPIFTLMYYLLIDRSTPIKAGLYGIYSSLLIALLRKNTRYNFRQLLQMLFEGATGAISVISACACAGIIIGVLSLTGLGNKIAGFIVAISGGNLLLALLLSMIVLIILGMGLPTTAAYIITSTIVAPALIEMDVMPIAAHMFIFYFACMSAITPPVAIASYAAAGISNSNPNTTGWVAFKLGLAAFIVPYLFVYNPTLIAQGTISAIITSGIAAIIGIFFFAAAISGWLFKELPFVLRIPCFIGALLLIDSSLISDIIGLTICGLCIVYQKFLNNKEKSIVMSSNKQR